MDAAKTGPSHRSLEKCFVSRRHLLPIPPAEGPPLEAVGLLPCFLGCKPWSFHKWNMVIQRLNEIQYCSILDTAQIKVVMKTNFAKHLNL